jgi:hypothetical protein
LVAVGRAAAGSAEEGWAEVAKVAAVDSAAADSAAEGWVAAD